ncbi:MAG: YdcF family protein [Burkholderiaceae bacterium]
MNDLLILLGAQNWKPALTALALPPVPWLLLMLFGARLMFWKRSIAWLTMLLGAALVWLSCTSAVGEFLERALLKPPPALSAERLAEIKRSVGSGKKVAIVILGGGRDARAPEYALSHLSDFSLARLHYGVWLSRQTGAPMLFSGGVAYGQSVGVAEAETAARIAERDYGRPLTWTEAESRDTRDNAARSTAILKTAGVGEILLVTNGWHMRRSMRAFEQETQRSGSGIVVSAAPMGLAPSGDNPLLRWLPSMQGSTRVRVVLREALGLLFGA